MQDKEFLRQHQPTPNQVVVHNLNIDKVEVHEKTSFLSSYPHEVPCLGLMSALLNYQKLSEEVRGIYSSLG